MQNSENNKTALRLTVDELAQHFPSVFSRQSWAVVPLANTVEHELVQRGGFHANPDEVQEFFNWYRTQREYLIAVSIGIPKRDLSGQYAEIPTVGERQEVYQRLIAAGEWPSELSQLYRKGIKDHGLN